MERAGDRPVPIRIDPGFFDASPGVGSGLTVTAERLDPPFRWPGGKRWLIDRLVELVPANSGRFFEPFFGGGALFWALRPDAATISDSNAALMDCYTAIRDHPRGVSARLRELPQDGTTYYRVRSERPVDDLARAARFIYLTTLAFNGIFRVNKAGDFNVPFSGRSYPRILDDSYLERYADALRNAEIMSGDFESAVKVAIAGDVVYLDPPYTVKHGKNGFVKYNARIFSWTDQERLARVAQDLANRGCSVIVSNADHDSIRDLYQGFAESIVTRNSAIAATPKHRGEAQEIVLTNVG